MKIFISIASYQDSFLASTMLSAYEAAKYKDSLVFGVLDQSDSALPELPFASQIRYMHLNPVHARGPSWARSVIQSFVSDEDYFLQIDSHTLFRRGWDEFLVGYWERLKEYHAKPIISNYPRGFRPQEGQSGKLSFELERPNFSGVYPMRVKSEHEFKEEYCFAQHCLPHDRAFPEHGYLLGAGFIFCSTEWVHEVPYDRFLYFHGEEQAMMLRSFTRGYSVFHVPDVPIFHKYNDEENKDDRPLHWDQAEDSKRDRPWYFFKNEAIKRFEAMMEGRLPRHFCLGSERSLADYRHISGICFDTRMVVDKQKAYHGALAETFDWKMTLDEAIATHAKSGSQQKKERVEEL